MAPFQKHLRFIPGLLIVIASLLIGSVRGNAQPPSILLEPPVSNDENPLRTVFVDRDVDANGGLSETEFITDSQSEVAKRKRAFV